MNLACQAISMTFLFAISTIGQVPTTKPTTRTARPMSATTQKVVPHASQKEALALFDSAVRHQNGALPSGTVKSFHGQFSFRIELPAGEDIQRLEGSYEQKWAFAERKGVRKFAYRRTIDTKQKDWVGTLVCDFEDFVFGFQGKRQVIIDPNSNKKNIERIKEEKHATRRMYDLFFLNEIRHRPETFRVIKRKTPVEFKIGNVSKRNPMGSKAADIIAFTDKSGIQVELAIDVAKGKSPEVVRARIFDPKNPQFEDSNGKRKPVPEIFEFGYYWDVPLPTGEKVKLPTRVRYSIGKREVLVITAKDVAALKINALKNLKDFEFLD